jgi:hypothetical protein
MIPIAVGGVVVALGVGAFALSRPHAMPTPDAGVVAMVREPDADVRPPDDAAMVREPDAAPPVAQVAPVAQIRHVATAPGWYSIDSTPFATIAIDDRPAGVTPLVHKPLAAGRHHVHAVLGDGRTKDVVIVVPPGKLAAPIVLHW